MLITIPGPPIAKARARTVRRGRFIHTYDPQQQTKQSIKNTIECAIHEKLGGSVPLPIFDKDIAIEARLTFFMPYPKNPNTWTIENEPHLTKPDLDNLEKFLLDCLSSLAFADDRQIISLSSTKKFSQNPRTEIEIMEKNSTTLDTQINKILTLFSKEDAKELHALSSQLLQKTDSFSFDDEPKVWAASTSSLLTTIANKFSKKLAQIKKIDNSNSLEAGGHDCNFLAKFQQDIPPSSFNTSTQALS